MTFNTFYSHRIVCSDGAVVGPLYYKPPGCWFDSTLQSWNSGKSHSAVIRLVHCTPPGEDLKRVTSVCVVFVLCFFVTIIESNQATYSPTTIE